MQNTCAAAYHGTIRRTKDYPQRIQCQGTVVAIGLATVRQRIPSRVQAGCVIAGL